ncbi:hypothetical protein [Bacteroides sp. An19]|nr:hypothetical protein [Bacteroides sp. An19]
MIRKTMQNGAKEPDGQENAAKRVIPAIKRRKEKPKEAECRTSSGKWKPQIFVGKWICWFIGLLMPSYQVKPLINRL